MKRRTVWQNEPIHFSSIMHFEREFSLSTKSCNIQIQAPHPILMSWINRGSEVTLVTFNAAIRTVGANTVPVITGKGTTAELTANVLMISDPTLEIDTQLNLSWYSGNPEQPYLVADLSRVLQVFQLFSRLVLFGSSGGGYASLLLSAVLPGETTALVCNPQTDITKFPYFKRYQEIVWERQDDLPIATSVIGFYSRPIASRVIYLQNAQDWEHVKYHRRPLVQSLHPDNQFISLNPKLGGGHIGPDKQTIRELFELVTTVYEWNNLEERIGDLPIHSIKTRPLH